MRWTLSPTSTARPRRRWQSRGCVNSSQRIRLYVEAAEDVLPADQLARLDKSSRIEFGFPYSLLSGPEGKVVYGDLEPQIDLPAAAPYRWPA